MSEKSINSDGSDESNKDIDLNNTNNKSTIDNRNVSKDQQQQQQQKDENELSPESLNKNDKENKPIDDSNDINNHDKNSNNDKDSKKKSTKSASGTSTPVKRSKSFTGCYTCRRRKIGCDLGRPSCNRCLKSGFICEGYHVKLRWSNPIRFDKYGYQLPNNQNNQEQMEYSQRRRLDFVKYPKDQVYEMYDEMDSDLSSLHNENIKDLNQNIRLLGPFGVFRGEKLDESKFKRRRKNPKNLKNKNDTTNNDNGNGLNTPMKSSKSSTSINNNNHSTANTNGISTNNTSVNNTPSNGTPTAEFRQDNFNHPSTTQQYYNNSNNNNSNNGVAATKQNSNSNSNSIYYNRENQLVHQSNQNSHTNTHNTNTGNNSRNGSNQFLGNNNLGNEWLSTELLNDALVTVLALNGDTQILDFLKPDANDMNFQSNQQNNVNNNNTNNNNDNSNHQFNNNRNSFSSFKNNQQYDNMNNTINNSKGNQYNNGQFNNINQGNTQNTQNNHNNQNNNNNHQNNQNVNNNYLDPQVPVNDVISDQMLHLLFHRQDNENSSSASVSAPTTAETSLTTGTATTTNNNNNTSQSNNENFADRMMLRNTVNNDFQHIDNNMNSKINNVNHNESGTSNNNNTTTAANNDDGNRKSTNPNDLYNNTNTSTASKYNNIYIHADNGAKMPTDLMEVTKDNNFLPPSLAIDKFGLPTTSLNIHPMTRYLLNYYIEHVADIMTVIPLPKNPWKFIYFPRAIMAIGELGSLGKTSNARNGLLNALLAVSAFNLQSKFKPGSDEMKYYVNLGILLRQQASQFLSKCLEEDIILQKYKDVLVAVLSMVTIDIVWGTMSACKVHLDYCEKIIEKKMKFKKKLSAKATILHRIFSSLKLIQDSTSLQNISKDEIFLNETNFKKFITGGGNNGSVNGGGDESGISTPNTNGNGNNNLNNSNHINASNIVQSPDDEIYSSRANTNTNTIGSNLPNNNNKKNNNNTGVFHEKINDKGKIRIEFIVNENDDNGNEFISNELPSFIDITKSSFQPSKNKIDDNEISSDAIYGLPNSLILLFSEVVHLIRFKSYYESNQLKLPNFFNELSTILENKLLKWKLEWKLTDNRQINHNNSNNSGDYDNKSFNGSEVSRSTTTTTTAAATPNNNNNILLMNNNHGNNINLDINTANVNTDKLNFISKRHEGIYHHVMSFHHALIIYFCRLIKDVNPLYLQERVEIVLHHLNEIQEIVENNKDIIIIPLFWQGFIAGSEAMTLYLQNGFNTWGQHIALSGVGTYWNARQIMFEVWKRKNNNVKRGGWVDVLKDWRTNVMLT